MNNSSTTSTLTDSTTTLMAFSEALEIVERDEAGNVTSTYIESASSNDQSRIDTVVRSLHYIDLKGADCG